MMNVEVLTAMSTPWSSKCGPPKYGYEGFVDHPGRLYSGNSSGLVESISWVQFAERDAFITPKPRQETAVLRGVAPAKPSSIQVAGKSVLGRGENASLPENSLQQGDNTKWYCETFEDSSLIPGLPEDVSQMILALVRREDFPSVRKVCKAWWDLISTREFYLTRKGVGTLEEWLYVLTVAEDMKSTQWEVLNPKQQGKIWKVLPRMPGPVKVGSSSIVVNEKLVVIGGLVLDDEKAYASAEVYIYDPVLDNWTKVTSMETARYEFACGVLDGKVYVVGGHGNDEGALSSMEVYDLENDKWSPSISLKKPRWGSFAAGVEGKLYVLGGRSSFTLGSARFMDVFDPETGNWQEVKNGAAMVLTHAVVNGKIFCIEWKDERSLRCYDTATNLWTKVTLPLPCKSRAGFCMGTYGGKLQFFPTTAKPFYQAIVYDPDAPKGSEWQTTPIKARGAVLSCATMTA